MLGCEVPPETWAAWEVLWAPGRQPFFVGDELAAALTHLPRWSREEYRRADTSLDVTDTLLLYQVHADVPWVIELDEPAYRALPCGLRADLLRAQVAAGRGGVERLENWDAVSAHFVEDAEDGLFVWWPSLWRAIGSKARRDVVESRFLRDRLPCRAAELSEEYWNKLKLLAPGVRALAGTFAPHSGPNCLAAALAGLGVPGVANVWLHAEPFERWLSENTRLVAGLDAPGTLLVWRDAGGRIQHVALSLGEGWLFHKEAQSWWAPRQIVRTQDALARWNEAGWSPEGYARA